MSQKSSGSNESAPVVPPKMAPKPEIPKTISAGITGSKSGHAHNQHEIKHTKVEKTKSDKSSKIGHDSRLHELPHQVQHMQINYPQENEWEAREEMRLRELEEARARAAQMEKTMRWWSDCTANWREKWSKVRNERNKAREESRQLRSKLETSVKDCTTLKREKQELSAEVETLKKQVEINQNSEKDNVDIASSSSSQMSQPERDLGDNAQAAVDAKKDIAFLDKLLQQQNNLETRSLGNENVPMRDVDSSSAFSEGLNQRRPGQRMLDELSGGEDSLAEQKIVMLNMKLDEADKTVRKERDEKSRLVKESEKSQTEVVALKNKLEEMRKSRHDVLQELTKLKNEHQDQLSRVALDLEDESYRGSNMDRRLADLRAELERLQAENATEWGKRERLETEKIALERENKKLRIQVTDLEESVEKKHKHASAMLDSDVKSLQKEAYEKNKELSDLKHVHSKVKKHLNDKTIELEHAKRRAEQYELEVKKLRGRVDELKKDLATAEDEVDTQSNNVRKLQRTNDELQEEAENLQVQVDHLQSRLRNSAITADLFSTRPGVLNALDPGDESTTDAFDTDDDTVHD